MEVVRSSEGVSSCVITSPLLQREEHPSSSPSSSSSAMGSRPVIGRWTLYMGLLCTVEKPQLKIPVAPAPDLPLLLRVSSDGGGKPNKSDSIRRMPLTALPSPSAAVAPSPSPSPPSPMLFPVGRCRFIAKLGITSESPNVPSEELALSSVRLR